MASPLRSDLVVTTNSKLVSRWATPETDIHDQPDDPLQDDSVMDTHEPSPVQASPGPDTAPQSASNKNTESVVTIKGGALQSRWANSAPSAPLAHQKTDEKSHRSLGHKPPGRSPQKQRTPNLSGANNTPLGSRSQHQADHKAAGSNPSWNKLPQARSSEASRTAFNRQSRESSRHTASTRRTNQIHPRPVSASVPSDTQSGRAAPARSPIIPEPQSTLSFESFDMGEDIDWADEA